MAKIERLGSMPYAKFGSSAARQLIEIQNIHPASIHPSMFGGGTWGFHGSSFLPHEAKCVAFPNNMTGQLLLMGCQDMMVSRVCAGTMMWGTFNKDAAWTHA